MTKFDLGVEIDSDKYGLNDVEKWADELEKTPTQILDMVQNWDEKKWAVFAHYNFDTSLIEDINELDIDTNTVHINGEDIYMFSQIARLIIWLMRCLTHILMSASWTRFRNGTSITLTVKSLRKM